MARGSMVHIAKVVEDIASAAAPDTRALWIGDSSADNHLDRMWGLVVMVVRL